MTLCITEKGARIVKLIKAVRAAGTILPGNKVRMPEERSAMDIGPVMDGGVQMGAFRLFDGMEVSLEILALDLEPGQAALLPACEAARPAGK